MNSITAALLLLGGLYFSSLVGCASHNSAHNLTVIAPVAGVTGRTLSANEVNSLRSGEVVKKYYVGAYVDPSHPHVRHDPHMVERVEQTSRWNLRPNVPVVATGPTYQAVEDNALKNAMQQQHDHEMQKQRLANEEVHNQTAGMREEIRQLKERICSGTSSDLTRVEEKIESLSSKIASMEASIRPTQNGGDNLPNQSTLSKVKCISQSSQQSQTASTLNPWEKPIQ